MSTMMCIPKGSSKESIAVIYRDIETEVKLSLIDLCSRYCKYGDVQICLEDGKIYDSPDISDEQLMRDDDPAFCDKLDEICKRAIATGNTEEMEAFEREIMQSVEENEMLEKRYTKNLKTFREIK